jgi:hypothetical protein
VDGVCGGVCYILARLGVVNRNREYLSCGLLTFWSGYISLFLPSKLYYYYN